MIMVMRNRLRDTGMTTIVWIAFASLALGSLLSPRMKQASEKWAFRVNKEYISYQHYARAVAVNKHYVQNIRMQYGQLADYLIHTMGLSNINRLSMQQVIVQSLTDQVIKAIGFLLSDDYIAEKMYDSTYVKEHLSDIIPMELLNEETGFDPAILKMLLEQNALSMEQFQEQISRRIGHIFAHRLINSFDYTPDYARAFNEKQQNALKDFTLFTLRQNGFLDEVKKNPVLQESLERFYKDQNQKFKRYHAQEKRLGEQWTFAPETYGIRITPEMIEDYYEQNKVRQFVDDPTKIIVRQIVFDAKEKADEAYQELKQDPKIFSEYARNYSRDDESAKQGGLLPALSRGTKSTVFEKMAFSLQTDTALSPVFENNGQFYILQRVEKIPQTYKSLNAVKGTIEKDLLQKRFSTQFVEDFQQAINAQDSKEALDRFIKKHNGKKNDIAALAQDKGKSNKALFKLQKGDYTSLVDGTNGVIIHLATIEPAYTPQLQDIKDTVVEDYYEQKASELQGTVARELSKNPQEALKERAALVKAETIPSLSSKANRLKDLGLTEAQIHEIKGLEMIGSMKQVRNGDDLFVIRLDAIKIPENRPEKRDTAKEKTSNKRSFIEGFIASLYRAATIETNDIISMISEENTI